MRTQTSFYGVANDNDDDSEKMTNSRKPITPTRDLTAGLKSGLAANKTPGIGGRNREMREQVASQLKASVGFMGQNESNKSTTPSNPRNSGSAPGPS